ncbi:uncharacterized protein LOC113868573 isoform X2 [Abrus precatorius]|uniref:Uncharacterized protein LOC113868573 isoform X2 n=1 Tax=Abrus precatorius TaxID=3816 RepID=A0A8B8LWI2_ABRPR|nr:uncharacterized protein LOC113868573 isoform X2 [Abrus precatorius]XP_027360068.1 uncharacterized protein LOC113868573 isoform X2 [Abrus precatorius]
MAAGTHYCASLFLRPLSSFQPIHFPGFNPPSIRSRFSGASVAVVVPRLPRRAFRAQGLVGDDSVTAPQPESNNSEEAGASIDLSLPRRSLLVQFTCDLCGERTKRLVNRLAYERGAVFVQCAGCLRHHKLVDNLGLITEYDFREKINMDSEIDQV